ncbi:hypothetical protein DOY81_010515, partial [Sarcophaga bullata]
VNETFPPNFEVENGFVDPAAAEDVNSPETVVDEQEEKPVITLVDHVMRDPCLFGDFRNATNESEPRLYEDLLDYEAVYHLFNEILEEYQERKGKMALVLFEDCLEHLTRVHRTLRMHRGHVLLWVLVAAVKNA